MNNLKTIFILLAAALMALNTFAADAPERSLHVLYLGPVSTGSGGRGGGFGGPRTNYVYLPGQTLAPEAIYFDHRADATDLTVIARCAGVSVEQIKELNPELRRWATPPVAKGTRPYRLRLPTGSKDRFIVAFADVKPSERFTYRSYRVRKGDTLGRIAMAWDTSVDAVMRANKLRNSRSLRVGQELQATGG